MILFIFANCPKESQLVVACEDLHGIDPGGQTVLFDQRLKVLSEQEY
jgi:hypothetical protein